MPRSSGAARLVVLTAAAFVALHLLSTGRAPGVAMVEAGEADEGPNFVTKVVSAAAQGATAATVAALLSAVTEPLVNRLLVKRMTFGQAYAEINFQLVSNFFLTTFPTNMLKFPVFEVINMAMQFTTLSGGLRGVVSGWLFCTIMLPITNYRFRKSMGWEIKPELLYQAYIPTVARDIVYGWARNYVGGALNSGIAPASFVGWAACIISSPCNEWRGFTLQPPTKKLPFGEYFKPVNYARSTGIGASIMGIALMIGMLVTPYAEVLFAHAKSHWQLTAGVLFGAAVLAG